MPTTLLSRIYDELGKSTFCQEYWYVDKDRGDVTQRTTPSDERLTQTTTRQNQKEVQQEMGKRDSLPL